MVLHPYRRNASELPATGVGGGFSTCLKMASNTGPADFARAPAKLIGVAVNIGDEEERFIVSGPGNGSNARIRSVSCALAKSGINRGSSSASAFASAGDLIGKAIVR